MSEADYPATPPHFGKIVEMSRGNQAVEDTEDLYTDSTVVETVDGLVYVEPPVLLDSLSDEALRDLLTVERGTTYYRGRQEEIRTGRIANIELILQDRASKDYRDERNGRIPSKYDHEMDET